MIRQRIELHLALRPLSRTLFLNGGNPADEIAALVIGVGVAFIVWLIVRRRVGEEDDDTDDSTGDQANR